MSARDVAFENQKSGDECVNEDHPIHEAAKADVQQLSAFLDRKPDLRDQPGWFGRQPLHVAAQAGLYECVDLLLKRGANPNAQEHLHQQSPLHFAVGSDSVECIDRLVHAGADVNAADSRGERPFSIVITKGHRTIESNTGRPDVIPGRGNTHSSMPPTFGRSKFAILIEHGRNQSVQFGWPALNALPGMTYGPESSPNKETTRAAGAFIESWCKCRLCDRSGILPYVACSTGTLIW